MGNLQVSYDAIMDHCAMIGVHRPVCDIDKMLLGQIKMDAKVAEAVKSAAQGVPVKFNTDAAKPQPTTTEEQRQQIFALIEAGNTSKKQLLELSGLEEYVLTQVLQILRKSKKIHCAGTNGSYRWLVGEKVTKRGLMSESRLSAKKAGLKTYDGAVHARCETTRKYVQSGNCWHCHKQSNRDRYIKSLTELNIK